MRQCVEQAEKITSDSPGCCHDGRQEEEIALIVVVMVVIELLFDGVIESSVDVIVCELCHKLPVAFGVCASAVKFVA